MTHLSRRHILQLAAGAALAAPARPALALDWPTRPVKMIVGFAAGGPTDVAARIVAKWLSERLGQAFVIENRAGAAGNIAAEYAVRAAPDGYTLLVVGAPTAINATLYGNLKFSATSDLAPIAGIARVPEVMVLHPSVPATTVPEFIAYAKANPGKINMAAGGSGTVPDMAGALFRVMTGLDLVRVNYRGGAPALVDLLAGQVQLMFESTLITAVHAKAGKLRALAVTTAQRSALLPDLPTVGDFVPGYQATAWYGLAAPKDTPGEIVEKLNRELNAGLADPGIAQKLADLGGTPMPMTAGELGKLIADETERWGGMIRKFNIKAE
jgi:tripartite-type tricarboxylate transporter receptor subunit TctC